MLLSNMSRKIKIPADVFSCLVPKAPVAALNQIVVLQCTDAQHLLVKEIHEWYYAHYGVDRTILHLTQRL